MAYTFKHGDRPLEGVTIQRAVGRGGFGEVYYAKTDSGKEIALKFLRENPEVELRGVAQVMNLKSPHLITIYDVRRNSEGDPFVMMEYVSGPSLHELMSADSKGLGIQKGAFFLNGIAKGLSYLHDRGIVHRDLKPGNIFYDEGYVKIGDYGLSKHLSVSRHSGNTVSVGTVHYMAPEIGSGSYSKAIDIYALGVILYEMLTGGLPFTGSSMAEILMRHLQDRPDVGAIPEPFRSVILKALQKNPADRYQDVNEMVDAVMASTEITAGFNSFDPSSLASNYQRGTAADEPVRTVTTPPRQVPVPPLDVHAPPPFVSPAAGGIPEIPRLPDERAAYRRGAAPGAAASSSGTGAWLFDLVRNVRGRWPIALSFAAVLVLVAGLAGTINGADDTAPLAVGWFLLMGAFTVLYAQLSIIPRSSEDNPLVEKIVTASIAGALMLPGVLIGNRNAYFIVPILASIVINKWGERVIEGRRGEVRIGSAIGPAFVGLLAGGAVSNQLPEAKLAFPLIAGSLCLLVQLGASLWPMARIVAGRTPAARPVPPPPPPGGPMRGPTSPPAGAPFAGPGGPAGPFPGPRGMRVASIRLRALQGLPSWTRPAAHSAELVPQGWRVTWAVLLCIAVATAVAGFVGRGVAARTDDDRIALMALGFGGVAAAVLFSIKLGQKHRRSLIGGTIRPIVLSFALFIIGLMVAVLSGDSKVDGDKIAGCVFGMVAATGIALVSLIFRWERAALPAGQAADLPQTPDPEPQFNPAPTAAAPSFVGRAANAGMGFVGKLLLLGSLALALLANVQTLRIQSPRGVVSIQDGTTQVIDQRGVELMRAQVPTAAFLGPMIGGTILLMVARRSDGGLHFLRGLGGCGLGLVAAILAVGPASQALRILIAQRDWHEMAELTNPRPLIVAGVAALGSLLLLLWPKRRPGRTIVI